MKTYWFAVYSLIIKTEFFLSTSISQLTVNIAVESEHGHFPFAKSETAAWEKARKEYPDYDISPDNSAIIQTDHGTLDESEYHSMKNK